MKFPWLQVFRGFAAVLVVLLHFNVNTNQYYHVSFLHNIFNFGYIGVDFFFVLSGFIITYIHYKDLWNGTGVAAFIRKRLVRIYPVYWVVALISLFAYIFFTGGYIQSLSIQLRLEDWTVWRYLARCFALVPGRKEFFIQPAWSLSFELMFYAVFALWILAGVKISRWLAFLWVAGIMLNYFVYHFNGNAASIIFHRYNLEFLTGCVVAYTYRQGFVFPAKPLRVLMFVLPALLIFLYACTPEHFDEKRLYVVLLLAVYSSVLVFAAVQSRHFNDKNPVLRKLVLLGDASYSVYLTHILFMSVIGRLAGKYIIAMQLPVLLADILLFGIVGLVITAGVCFHLWVEKPVLKLFQRKNLSP